MKKICHITSTPQDFVPRLLRESATALKLGYQPYIVAQGKSFEKDGIYFVGVNKATSRLDRMIRVSRKLIEEGLAVDADIYQLHDPELLPYASKFLKLGKKVIFDSHEFYGIQIQTKAYIPKFLRKLLAEIYMKYEAYVCKKIDGVLFVCTINGENYFENRAKYCKAIANFPDLTFFTEQKLFGKTKTIVYAGALSTSRGIDYLVKSMSDIDGKLILCGMLSSPDYLEKIRSLDENQKVDYRGVLEREALVEILSEARIGLSTLLHSGQYNQIDTLPTKVYEYMALGLPVILSNTAYATKMIEKYQFGICVNPENTEQIAEAINFLLANEEVAREMGRKGKKLAQNQFNWQVEEQKLIDVYKNMI